MVKDVKGEWFEGVESIVSEPLKFKAKLRIGDDAYASMRVKNKAFELWNAAGTAGLAVVVANSTTVASTFFAPTGVLAAFGLGTAVTPIGWVIAAGVVAGGGWIGITRYLKKVTDNRVTRIPDFINSPLDVLALGLFDLMAPLALKIAAIDGDIADSEIDTISDYFVKQWGFDRDFVQEGMAFTVSRLPEFSVKDLARSLGEFQKHNKDCNFKEMSRELVNFLREVMEADGRIDEREEMAIEKVQAVFDDVARLNLSAMTKRGAGAVTGATKSGVDAVVGLVRTISSMKIKHNNDQC